MTGLYPDSAISLWPESGGTCLVPSHFPPRAQVVCTTRFPPQRVTIPFAEARLDIPAWAAPPSASDSKNPREARGLHIPGVVTGHRRAAPAPPCPRHFPYDWSACHPAGNLNTGSDAAARQPPRRNPVPPAPGAGPSQFHRSGPVCQITVRPQSRRHEVFRSENQGRLRHWRNRRRERACWRHEKGKILSQKAKLRVA